MNGSTTEIDAKLTALLDQVAEANRLAIEGLTKDQLVSVLVQAVKSGDFVRYLGPGTRQCVVYLPWHEADRWRGEFFSLLNAVSALAEDEPLDLSRISYPLALTRLADRIEALKKP